MYKRQIWNPWWASISVDNPALPYLKEIVNLVHVDSLVTPVFTADEDEKNVGLHSKCHTVFTPVSYTHLDVDKRQFSDSYVLYLHALGGRELNDYRRLNACLLYTSNTVKSDALQGSYII